MPKRLIVSESPAISLIQIDHISKTYRTRWGKKAYSLRDVSLEVRHGEVFGLLGPNGAGKTTTFGILLGFQRPSSGRGTIFGRPLGSVEVRKRIGFLSENPYFYDHVTARELLQTFADLYDLSAEKKRGIDSLLESVGIDPGRKKRLRKYSKGMRQRVGLAQAVMHDPELVILDEPMSGLDPAGRREFRNIIANLKRKGTTVLLASHVLSDIEALADRVAFLIEGSIAKVGTVDELVHTGRGSFEIITSSLPGRLLIELSKQYEVQHGGNRVVISVTSSASAEAVIQQVFTHGSRVLAMRPTGESLEDAFMGEINKYRLQHSQERSEAA